MVVCKQDWRIIRNATNKPCSSIWLAIWCPTMHNFQCLISLYANINSYARAIITTLGLAM